MEFTDAVFDLSGNQNEQTEISCKLNHTIYSSGSSSSSDEDNTLDLVGSLGRGMFYLASGTVVVALIISLVAKQYSRIR